MKKGCFLKVIIILTIFIAAVLYIVENHFDDFILKPGENIIKDLVFSDVNKKMEFVKKTPEKDSLKVLINNFVFDKLHKEHRLDSKEFQGLIDSIKTALNDSIISLNELENLRLIFKKEINEGSKEN
jgi:hypothetical protein